MSIYRDSNYEDNSDNFEENSQRGRGNYRGRNHNGNYRGNHNGNYRGRGQVRYREYDNKRNYNTYSKPMASIWKDGTVELVSSSFKAKVIPLENNKVEVETPDVKNMTVRDVENMTKNCPDDEHTDEIFDSDKITRKFVKRMVTESLKRMIDVAERLDISWREEIAKFDDEDTE